MEGTFTFRSAPSLLDICSTPRHAISQPVVVSPNVSSVLVWYVPQAVRDDDE